MPPSRRPFEPLRAMESIHMAIQVNITHIICVSNIYKARDAHVDWFGALKERSGWCFSLHAKHTKHTKHNFLKSMSQKF